jgi:hypothetical protein
VTGGYAGIGLETTLKAEGDDGVRPYAIDPALAQRFWASSERWI